MTQWRLTWKGLNELPFIDFWEMSNAAMRDRGREAKAAMLSAAYTSWLMGAGERKTWREFCRHYGLIEEATRNQEKVNTKVLYEKTDRITEQALRNIQNGHCEVLGGYNGNDAIQHGRQNRA